MPTEQTPLLSKHESNIDMPRVEGLTTRSWFATFASIPYAAFRWHGVSIVVAVLSALLCWLLGYAHISIFDPLIFKSIFVVFGFAIGFRNARANERRGEAEAVTHELFAAAWSMLVVFPSDERPKVREALLFLMGAICQHINSISNTHVYKYGIVGLRPTPLADAAWWDCGQCFRRHPVAQTNLSPRSLLVTTLLMFEEEFERLKPRQSLVLRTFHRTTLAFKTSFERMVTLAMPSISDRLKMLINFCLFMFALALPWGIESRNLNLHQVNPDPNVDPALVGHLSAGGFKVVNTFVCTVVLFGLNALAQEHEDPFADATDDIDLDTLLRAFQTAVQSYEERRLAAEQGKAGLSPEEVADLHRFICGTSKAPMEV